MQGLGQQRNTKLDSVITAVYYGDETFKPSENWGLKDGSATEWEVKAAEIANKVIPDTVTVYSSVVYNCKDENKNQTTGGERGIHISKADGLFLANESATLKLSDVYTLDRELSDDLRDIVAKLNPNKDYTVQWQKLTGATNDRDFAKSERWEDITGATGTTLLLKPVEQDTAYRAVITVKNPATPIVKGSFELIDQGTVNTKDANDGRQVYYSNVMMPTSGETTIAVAVNTNERGDNLEGITEGETVTVNVLVSGAVGAVPNATLNVTIKADDTKGNATGYEKTFTSKATVDGWNAFEWDTGAEQVQPGFYTLTVVATSNTGYMTETITRSLIVRESSYKFNVFAALGASALAADGGQQFNDSFGPPSTPSGGGAPSYRVIVDESQKEQLKPDRSTATAGSTVTIKVADGVTADDIKVVDKNGKLVEIKKIDDNTYTFVMPASDVNVSGLVEDLRLNDTDHFAYITGYPDGTFKPNGNLTRAEAATIFYRLLLDQTMTKNVQFSDVPAGKWYETAVKTLASKGVITGYTDGTFKPTKSVTRAEFCAMASRFFSLKEGSVKFTDVPTTFWGYKYIASVVARGYLDDVEGAYEPNGAITRAEVVSIVNRMLSRSADSAYLAKGDEGLKTFTDVAETDACYLDVMEAANGHDYTKSGKTETWKNLK